MRSKWIKTAIGTGLLTVGALQAEILYEKDGIALEGAVRLVVRNAATCHVLEENETPETYEATKANDGRPLHVWRLDYGALNASSKALSNLTAHFQIEAEWPPCTNWTGLGQYPGPVRWASSFETLQRRGGMQPAELATATTYVLAIDGQEPRFRNWQVNFQFGPVTAATDPAPGPPAAVESERTLALLPSCEGLEFPASVEGCWTQFSEPPDCRFWNTRWIVESDCTLVWTGGCERGLASGDGVLTRSWDESLIVTEKGRFRNGRKQGHWVERNQSPETWPAYEEGPYVDGMRSGRWAEGHEWDDGWRRQEGDYVDNKMHGRWVDRSSDRESYFTYWNHGKQVSKPR